MSRYNINTIRSRLKTFVIARRRETIFPTSVMPSHVCFANEIAGEFPGCELSEDIEDVWEIFDGEICWKAGQSDFWNEFRDHYYFPVLKDWRAVSVLNYADPSGKISVSLVSLEFAKRATAFVITLVRTFPYADPDFESNVDAFLQSSRVFYHDIREFTARVLVAASR